LTVKRGVFGLTPAHPRQNIHLTRKLDVKMRVKRKSLVKKIIIIKQLKRHLSTPQIKMIFFKRKKKNVKTKQAGTP
jgi:hypothetical protein